MTTKEPVKDADELHLQVKNLLKMNYTNEAIAEELKKHGTEPYYIETIIRNIENEKADKKSFRNSMVMGSAYLFGGFLINVFSYRFSENAQSSSFFAFWGIVVLGIITILRGVILYKS